MKRLSIKLLKSPAYGEKMALHWLDLARYADSHGYQDDGYRTQWPWRDWVIHAFNKNMHYNDFVTWQLAGDLMPNASTKEQLLATGFNRNHKITEEGGVIPEEYRIMYVTDRNDLFGKGLLGVTLECAHCHDHKYDPFSQKEYYQLFAFFNNVKEVGIESVIGGPETYAKKPLMEISDEDVKSILSFVNKPDTNRLIVSVMGDLDTTRKTYILKRGVYDAPGEEVQPGTPKAILPFNHKYPKNRLGLAKWLFDKQESADGPGICQSVVAGIFWERHRENIRRFRDAGRTALSSRTARLAGRRFYGTWLGYQTTGETDGYFGYLPAVGGDYARETSRRSGQYFAGPRAALPHSMPNLSKTWCWAAADC